MSEKQELIKKMLAMQKMFIQYEHQNGVRQQDYFTPTENHPLAGYKEEYTRIANRVVELAHAEKGSKR